MKGIAESLLSRIGIREFEYSAEKSLQEEKPSNFLDPSQSITVSSGMRQIGLIGRIAPALVKTYDLRSDVWIALFDYSALYEIKRKLVENPAPVRPLPKYPSVERDIAIMLAEAISARQVEETIRASAKQEILRSIRLFDHFQSKEMKLASERSIAFHLVFRSDDRTLEEHEVDELIILIIKRLEGELHARLRV